MIRFYTCVLVVLLMSPSLVMAQSKSADGVEIPKTGQALKVDFGIALLKPILNQSPTEAFKKVYSTQVSAGKIKNGPRALAKGEIPQFGWFAVGEHGAQYIMFNLYNGRITEVLYVDSKAASKDRMAYLQKMATPKGSNTNQPNIRSQHSVSYGAVSRKIAGWVDVYQAEGVKEGGTRVHFVKYTGENLYIRPADTAHGSRLFRPTDDSGHGSRLVARPADTAHGSRLRRPSGAAFTVARPADTAHGSRLVSRPADTGHGSRFVSRPADTAHGSRLMRPADTAHGSRVPMPFYQQITYEMDGITDQFLTDKANDKSEAVYQFAARKQGRNISIRLEIFKHAPSGRGLKMIGQAMEQAAVLMINDKEQKLKLVDFRQESFHASGRKELINAKSESVYYDLTLDQLKAISSSEKSGIMIGDEMIQFTPATIKAMKGFIAEMK